jgi:hypothetical protein
MALKQFVTVPLVAVVCALWNGSTADAATVRSVRVFAQGAAVNASGPDSIAVADDSIWVSYTNGADSTGLGGSSTIVQYSFRGRPLHKFSVRGSVDGLKIDPRSGLVWALQNQDGNSTLTLIDPDEGITPDSPIPYELHKSDGIRRFDDPDAHQGIQPSGRHDHPDHGSNRDESGDGATESANRAE